MIKVSDKKLFLEVKDGKISVNTDCSELTKVRWQINESGRNWLILKTRETTIDYLGPIAYYVEAFCGTELMMVAEDFRLLKEPVVLTTKNYSQDSLVSAYVPDKDWDFSRLPTSEYNNALDAYEEGDTATLKLLHDSYILSPNSYCCGYGTIMKNHFKDAIQRGEITRQS